MAICSPRKQSRICLHEDDSDMVQLMYICHLKGCKVKIHKHIEFPEWIIFIKGKLQIIYFNDEGEQLKKLSINTKKSNGPVIQIIPKLQYHKLVFEEDSYFLEVKDTDLEEDLLELVKNLFNIDDMKSCMSEQSLDLDKLPLGLLTMEKIGRCHKILCEIQKILVTEDKN